MSTAAKVTEEERRRRQIANEAQRAKRRRRLAAEAKKAERRRRLAAEGEVERIDQMLLDLGPVAARQEYERVFGRPYDGPSVKRDCLEQFKLSLDNRVPFTLPLDVALALVLGEGVADRGPGRDRSFSKIRYALEWAGEYKARRRELIPKLEAEFRTQEPGITKAEAKQKAEDKVLADVRAESGLTENMITRPLAKMSREARQAWKKMFVSREARQPKDRALDRAPKEARLKPGKGP